MTATVPTLWTIGHSTREWSVFVAMLTLAAAYRMLRRMFGPTVALVALAGMSIALWPVFWGRVGLRAMTLPLMSRPSRTPFTSTIRSSWATHWEAWLPERTAREILTARAW